MKRKQSLAEGSLIRPDLIRSPLRDWGCMWEVEERPMHKGLCAPRVSHTYGPRTPSTILHDRHGYTQVA